MTQHSIYTLTQIRSINFSGFEYTIPEETTNKLNYLISQLSNASHTAYVPNKSSVSSSQQVYKSSTSSQQPAAKKRKGNKNMEVTSDDWDSIRTFQPTKMAVKSGFDETLDKIRLHLNKITDKTFIDIREKIIDLIRTIPEEYKTDENIAKLSQSVYDISSTNKFYSKLFADLYAELLTEFPFLKSVFDKAFSLYEEQFNHIEYVDADTNYDQFCEMNKLNERRRANTQFYVNLGLNGFISPLSIARILKHLVQLILDMVKLPNKKNEVDEITENIALLYNTDLLDVAEDDSQYSDDELYINEMEIPEVLTMFTNTKFPSLSNKSTFKYMDILKM